MYSNGHDLHLDYSGLLNLVNSKAASISLNSFIRTTSNDAGDTGTPRLIQLSTSSITDSSGNGGLALNIDYSALRSKLSTYANRLDTLNEFLAMVRYLTVTSPTWPDPGDNAQVHCMFNKKRGQWRRL